MEYPELWPRAIVDSREFGLTPPAFVVLETMHVSTTLLRDLVNAVQLFWLDIRIACNEALITENTAMIEEVARLQTLRPALL